jgi:hypothetical protein
MQLHFYRLSGFSSAAMIWLWLMSLDAHWYSTLICMVLSSQLVCCSGTALLIIVLIYLKRNGFYQRVTDQHIHDLGKFLFAFSIFWTYLWFSQFMLIWYANIGEETIYFKTRKDEWPILFYGNVIINFIFPFLALMVNDWKKQKVPGWLLVAAIVFIGHWLDFFLMIKPGVLTYDSRGTIVMLKVIMQRKLLIIFLPDLECRDLLEIGTLVSDSWLCSSIWYVNSLEQSVNLGI